MCHVKRRVEEHLTLCRYTTHPTSLRLWSSRRIPEEFNGSKGMTTTSVAASVMHPHNLLPSTLVLVAIDGDPIDRERLKLLLDRLASRTMNDGHPA